MNSGVGTRNYSKKKTNRRATSPKEPKPKAADSTAARFFVFTIDADSAQIVKVETLNKRGKRRQLSDEDKTRLLRERNGDPLEDMLERTFEAGIACALGAETAQESKPETDEDAELRHLLLARLIEHSDARDMLPRNALNRGFLEALIQHSINGAPAVRTH
jgi:hypothetical protein